MTKSKLNHLLEHRKSRAQLIKEHPMLMAKGNFFTNQLCPSDARLQPTFPLRIVSYFSGKACGECEMMIATGTSDLFPPRL
jgi:hypothetical protein